MERNPSPQPSPKRRGGLAGVLFKEFQGVLNTPDRKKYQTSGQRASSVTWPLKLMKAIRATLSLRLCQA